MPIDDEIKKGEKALKQLNEIKEEMNKNPLDITGNIKDKMKEIEEQLRKLKTVSTENIDEVKKLTEEFKELAATKEALEGLEKTVRGIGAALGIALPQLKALEIVMFIAQTVFEWSENSAKVNKQMYEIGANLGHMGEMAGIATGKVNSLAWQFGVTTEEVRNTEIGLTKIGIQMKDVEEITKNQLALSKLWAEYTPQEQTRIMSRYMKEFGMNGKEAQNVMIGIVDLANSLKDVMPKLDIKEFASQVQDVAVSMRKYGLETSDSIALTATLTKLGIDQARIPELAKAMGGFAMGGPALGAFTMDVYKGTLEKEEDEYAKLEAKRIKLQKEGGKELDEISRKRLQQLQEERVHRGELIEQIEKAGAAEKAGLINTLEAGDAIKANFAGMNAMLKSQGDTLGTISMEKLIGLSKISPELFPMGVAGAKAFVEARERFEKPLEKLKEGATPEERKTYEEQIALRKMIDEAGGIKGERGLQALFAQTLKDIESGKIKTPEEERTAAAKLVATHTTTVAADVGIIKGILGDWARSWNRDEERIKQVREEISRTGKPLSKEQYLERGFSEETVEKELKVQETIKSFSKNTPIESGILGGIKALWREVTSPTVQMSPSEFVQMSKHTEKIQEEEKAKEKVAEASKPVLPYSGFFPQYTSPQEPTGHITIGFDDTTGKLTAGYEAIKRRN